MMIMKKICESVWPPNVSLYGSSTYGYLPVLSGPEIVWIQGVNNLLTVSDNFMGHRQKGRRLPVFFCFLFTVFLSYC